MTTLSANRLHDFWAVPKVGNDPLVIRACYITQEQRWQQLNMLVKYSSSTFTTASRSWVPFDDGFDLCMLDEAPTCLSAKLIFMTTEAYPLKYHVMIPEASESNSVDRVKQKGDILLWLFYFVQLDRNGITCWHRAEVTQNWQKRLSPRLQLSQCQKNVVARKQKEPLSENLMHQIKDFSLDRLQRDKLTVLC